MKKLIFLITLLCVSLSSWAYGFTVGNIYYNITSSTSPYTVAVTYGTTISNTYSGIKNIPATVTNAGVTYSVTSIGYAAFNGCYTLTSVTIPSTVTTIETSAFNGCTGLTSVAIPSSVISIRAGAFYGCTGLTKIVAKMTSLPTLGSSVFTNVDFTKCKLVVPIDKIYLYKGDGISTEWGKFTNIVDGPTITTTFPTSITTTTAISGGTADDDFEYPITERGVCWGISNYPSIYDNKLSSGSGIGTFTSNLTGLTPNTTYYIRGYVLNSNGNIRYDNVIYYFTTLNLATPTLTTTTVTSISTTNATSGGTISSDGGAAVTVCGVCWSTVANPTTSNNRTIDYTGTGSFTSSITGLLPGTLYHIRAYATNSVGTSYGEDLTFTTPTTPSYDLDVTNNYLTNPGFGLNCNYLYNATAANLAAANGTANDLTVTGWTMTANSWTAAAAFECGYAGKLNNSTIPALASDGKSTGSGVGVLGVNAGWGGKVIYYQTVTLPAGKYKIIYTACNSSSSWAAISKVGWTTSATDSVLSTVTSFPQNVWVNDTIPFTLTATASGNILVGMQSQNTSSGSNGKIFFDYIKLIKTVDQTAPIITTTAASSILAKSASSGGNITSDGGSIVTARGVCWSTTANPTISNSKTTDGTGVGLYTSSITGLLPLTTYHIRAYASNSVGTAYGSDQTFTTLYNTALNDVQASNIDIYPNPSNGILNIKFENSTPLNSVVSLYNLVGQKVYTQQINATETQLNVAGYNLKGVYLLTVEDERGKVCSDRKIVFK